MARRLRREFQSLEAQLDYGVQERAWRALVDKVLYDKGSGPKPIVEQLRLRERLRTMHARRDRYNHKRGAIRLAAFQSLIDQGHLTGAMAIRLGLAEPTEGPLPRGLMIGSMAGDRRLSRKLLHELGVLGGFFRSPSKPWEMDRERIGWEAKARPLARMERRDFEQTLRQIDAVVFPPAPIHFGFEVSLEKNASDVPAKANRVAS